MAALFIASAEAALSSIAHNLLTFREIFRLIYHMVRYLPLGIICWGLSAMPLGAASKGGKAAKAAPETASAEVARVAILLYEDKTDTKNFEYMPGSLKEAITNSMHEKFEFNEVDITKVAPTAEQVKKKNKGVIGAKEAAEICRKTDIDILIFGAFTFNAESNLLEITTNISLGSTDKFRTLQPVQNKVDSTIFSAADKVATNIVDEITKIAREQQEAKGKAAELEKDKKTQLAKTEKRKTWADINWNITFAGGAHRLFVNQLYINTPVSSAIALYGMYRWKGNWHVGGSVYAGNYHTHSGVAPYRTEVRFIGSALTMGYFFDLSPRWRLTSAVGAGYYFGTYQVANTCSEGQMCFAPNVVPQTAIRNPFLVARAGVHFLIFSFLAAGIEADYRMLYDNRPLHSAGGALALTFIF